MTRHIKRGGKVWINVFPDKPVTQKPAETRMGSGKGNPERWVAVVKPGSHPVRAVLQRPGRSPARRSTGPSRSCRSRPASSRVRRRSDGEDHAQALRDLGDAELVERLAEAKEELFNLRFQHVTGQLDNSAGSGTCSKDIARINTELRAREIAAAEALAAERGDRLMADETRHRDDPSQPPQGP